MSYPPSPPQALSVTETLFRNIRVYVENSCRNIISDEYGTLLTASGAELRYDLCDRFDSYFLNATMFWKKGLHHEFCHALDKAFALVKQILRAEHPRTLACFLEVFIHLIQTGFPAVTSILRKFIKDMSMEVVSEGHPWRQICWVLGKIDLESIEQALAQMWECTADTFDNVLGLSSRLAVAVRLNYIKRVPGIKDYREEERLL